VLFQHTGLTRGLFAVPTKQASPAARQSPEACSPGRSLKSTASEITAASGTGATAAQNRAHQADGGSCGQWMIWDPGETGGCGADDCSMGVLWHHSTAQHTAHYITLPEQHGLAHCQGSAAVAILADMW